MDGFFVSQAVLLDENRLIGKDLGSIEFKQFVVNLKQYLTLHAIAINAKDTGQYSDSETIPGQNWFVTTTGQSSVVYRKRITTGALQNAAPTNVAHNIPFTAGYTVTRLYGTATDPGATLRYIPLPFVDVSGAEPAGNIELNVDATMVNIIPTGNATNFTRSFVVIEYTKN